jgi:hypothetical protein
MNQQNHLDPWAAEWAIQKALSAHPAPEPVLPPQLGAADPTVLTVGANFSASSLLLRQLDAAIAPDDRQRAFDSNLHLVGAESGIPDVALGRGEIRHLNPDLKPIWPRPVHVLVLSVDDSRQRALVIPFGPFTTPAFESELATGIVDESLAVLSVWNASWVPKDQVSRSWVVQQASPELLADIDKLRQTLVNKKPMPPDLLHRTGGPFLDPSDPRSEYISQEETLLDDLCRD